MDFYFAICVFSTATTPSLSAVCDFEQSLCGWSADPQSGVSWSLHTASSSSTGHDTYGTRQDLALGSDSEYSLSHYHTTHYNSKRYVQLPYQVTYSVAEGLMYLR